jgi:glycosyltransferase involved in cell wall biosynthesis
MRIAVNGLFLGQESTGSGQYTEQLLRALRQVGGEHEYVVYPSGPAIQRPDHPFIRLTSVDSSAGQTEKPGFQEKKPGFENLRKLWFEQVTFPRACRKARADVAHVPYWAPPLWPAVPTVVTVHDLIPILLPLYRGSVWVRLYTRLVAAAARRADTILTDSLASWADIVEHLHVPPERVQVIYLAADADCRPVTDEVALAAVRTRYGLPQRYILYLGGFDQRKNLAALFAAYARLPQALGDAAPALVVAGRLPEADTPLFPAPQRLAREAGVHDSVIFTGWVPAEDKPALYSGALFFAFLSLYEGFGLMPLEAMACGTPVLASNRSSLPEIVGDGGLLVDPADLDAVVAGMTHLLRDPALHARLRANALAQASRFTWQRTAEETLAVYERIYREERG